MPDTATSLSLDPATTAVVLVEDQNDFTTEGGALHGAAATSTAEHENALRFDYPMFSLPVTAGEVLEALGARS